MQVSVRINLSYEIISVQDSVGAVFLLRFVVLFSGFGSSGGASISGDECGAGPGDTETAGSLLLCQRKPL